MLFFLVFSFIVKKPAKKNFTAEGDQLFKVGLKILQQSKGQRQKAQ